MIIRPRLLFAVFWIAWMVSWIVAAFWANRTEKRAFTWDTVFYQVTVLIGAALLAPWTARRLNMQQLWHVGYDGGIALALLTLAGLLFTWWARFHLGRLWSGTITRKEGHRVIDTGPYALVRHPIYTGLIFALFATAIAQATFTGLAGAVLIAFGLWVKARIEERFLTAELGADAYGAYRRRVPMLVPGIQDFRYQELDTRSLIADVLSRIRADQSAFRHDDPRAVLALDLADAAETGKRAAGGNQKHAAVAGFDHGAAVAHILHDPVMEHRHDRDRLGCWRRRGDRAGDFGRRRGCDPLAEPIHGLGDVRQLACLIGLSVLDIAEPLGDLAKLRVRAAAFAVEACLERGQFGALIFQRLDHIAQVCGPCHGSQRRILMAEAEGCQRSGERADPGRAGNRRRQQRETKRALLRTRTSGSRTWRLVHRHTKQSGQRGNGFERRAANLFDRRLLDSLAAAELRGFDRSAIGRRRCSLR